MIALDGLKIPIAPKFGQEVKVAGRPEMEEIVKHGRQLQKTLETLQAAIVDLQTRVGALE